MRPLSSPAFERMSLRLAAGDGGSSCPAEAPFNSSDNADMKFLIKLSALGVIASLLCSCSVFDSGTSWHSGRFQVQWIDVASSSHLSYRLDSNDSIGIVSACVFAAGASRDYVVVEQAAKSQSAPVSYYVLPKAGFNPLYPRQRLVGPLSASAYHAMAKRASLPAMARVVSPDTCSASAR